MKERPIIFNAEMVLAVLDGRKTQTRRVVNCVDRKNWIKVYDPSRPKGHRRFGNHVVDAKSRCMCPYGQPGDRMWVRETWCTGQACDQDSPSSMAQKCQAAGYSRPWCPITYGADGETNNADVLNDFGGAWGRWRHSIHMPRWASRILLEVTDVRVERVRDISEVDAYAEGVTITKYPAVQGIQHRTIEEINSRNEARCTFADLWDSINKSRGYGWDANPWVWVVEFRRVE